MSRRFLLLYSEQILKSVKSQFLFFNHLKFFDKAYYTEAQMRIIIKNSKNLYTTVRAFFLFFNDYVFVEMHKE